MYNRKTQERERENDLKHLQEVAWQVTRKQERTKRSPRVCHSNELDIDRCEMQKDGRFLILKLSTIKEQSVREIKTQ